MDIRRAASLFNQTKFDSYDFLTSLWSAEAFEGQLKYTQESFGINNLSSRKRMLFVNPDALPIAPVIRVNVDGVIFLVEGPQNDVINNTHYSTVFNLHEAQGAATITRRLPAGPPNNPGWAVVSPVEVTYVDVAFSRVPTDQENTVNQFGFYVVYLPSNSLVQDHDTIQIGTQKHFVFEVYTDQGLVCAKTTVKDDPRIDVIYVKLGAPTYDYDTGTTIPTATPYNITAQIEPVDASEAGGSSGVYNDAIKLLIDKAWLGIKPAVNDKINALGKVYNVEAISQDAIMDQWRIIANV